MPSPRTLTVLGGVGGGVEVVEVEGLDAGALEALGLLSPACSVGREVLRAAEVLRIVLGTGVGGRLVVL